VYRTAASGPAGGRDGFTVTGGAPSGTVTWVAWAQRGVVAATPAATGGPDAGTAGAAGAAGAGRRGAARVRRRAMDLPTR
jgi:hypothetical protein